MKTEYTYSDNNSIRLDVFLAETTGMSRSNIKNLINSKKIWVNTANVKAGYLLKKNDFIEIEHHKLQDINTNAENIPLDIVYEDDDLLVVNKQVGLVVHPCSTTKEHTLVNALTYHVKTLSGINGTYRPGIVHRLDKDTGGLLIVAKNDRAHEILAAQLKDKTLSRKYKALIKGKLKDDFVVEGYLVRNPKKREQMVLLPLQAELKSQGLFFTFKDKTKSNPNQMDIGKAISYLKQKELETHEDAGVAKNGKYSKTIFSVDKTFGNYTLLNCQLTTGRTHQIRAHLKYVGHPIVGDKLYGGKDKVIKADGQFLFAYHLEFIHPTTNERMKIEVNLPDYFKNVLQKIS